MSFTYNIENATMNYQDKTYKFDYEIIDKIINFNLLYKFYCGNFNEFCRNIINIIFDINIYSNKIRIDFTYSFINEDNIKSNCIIYILFIYGINITFFNTINKFFINKTK